MRALLPPVSGLLAFAAVALCAATASADRACERRSREARERARGGRRRTGQATVHAGRSRIAQLAHARRPARPRPSTRTDGRCSCCRASTSPTASSSRLAAIAAASPPRTSIAPRTSCATTAATSIPIDPRLLDMVYRLAGALPRARDPHHLRLPNAARRRHVEPRQGTRDGPRRSRGERRGGREARTRGGLRRRRHLPGERLRPRRRARALVFLGRHQRAGQAQPYPRHPRRPRRQERRAGRSHAGSARSVRSTSAPTSTPPSARPRVARQRPPPSSKRTRPTASLRP